MSEPTPFFSQLAADPVLGEIVSDFVREMPTRVEQLRSMAAAADWNALTFTAHQLKGSAGSYGFGQLTPFAKRLESVIQRGDPPLQVLDAVDELVSACERVRSGAPDARA